MEAGKLNRRVHILHAQKQRAPGGQEVKTWVPLAKVWASIRHKGGLETIRAEAEASIVQASIRVRYREDIDATMRVQHGARVYEIRAVLPDELRREYVDLVCEVGASRG
ncbi:phage head closure protein [Cupriavidus basilensis]|uniref:phage head closure protein n=1 Tax=Cupriavidus basilensis TaxID=68895 RepID=UPI0020A62AC1|nr:phage head closure protein [Cupriavidus basilensis]MCP3022300.1 phage head closure protein [Cupriavidus basilensis]